MMALTAAWWLRWLNPGASEGARAGKAGSMSDNARVDHEVPAEQDGPAGQRGRA
jgi:hypothetical protein